jgi:primosomal protein N''
MKREQLLRQLEVAKKRVVHAQDLFKRQQALMPTFQGTAFESEAQNLLAFLEDYRANKVAELDRLIDLLDGNADQDRAR